MSRGRPAASPPCLWRRPHMRGRGETLPQGRREQQPFPPLVTREPSQSLGGRASGVSSGSWSALSRVGPRGPQRGRGQASGSLRASQRVEEEIRRGSVPPRAPPLPPAVLLPGWWRPFPLFWALPGGGGALSRGFLHSCPASSGPAMLHPCYAWVRKPRGGEAQLAGHWVAGPVCKPRAPGGAGPHPGTITAACSSDPGCFAMPPPAPSSSSPSQLGEDTSLGWPARPRVLLSLPLALAPPPTRPTAWAPLGPCLRRPRWEEPGLSERP